MKIGLLVCGHIRDELREKHGSYRQMFHQLFAPFSSQIELHNILIVDGEYPDSLEEFDGYLITGSKFGIYESEPWIKKLLILIKQCFEQKIPVVGFCFGHQAIAQALGGLVEQSDKGWGIGLSSNQILHKQPWMEPWDPSLNLIVSHQDQVVDLPSETTVLASSDFCPYYMIQTGTLLGVQGHPEFNKAFSHDLIETRKEDIPAERISEGKQSLNEEVNNERMTQWVVNFFQQF